MAVKRNENGNIEKQLSIPVGLAEHRLPTEHRLQRGRHRYGHSPRGLAQHRLRSGYSHWTRWSIRLLLVRYIFGKPGIVPGWIRGCGPPVPGCFRP